MKTAYDQVQAFITRDGSEIRELMHPAQHGNRAQSLAETADAITQPSGRTSAASRASGLSRGPRLISLAEATVAPGQTTALHRHGKSEELYHVTAGHGRMTLDEETFNVGPGDTVCIPPGTPHRIENTGAVPLRILCCCTPPYAHADTELL